MTDAYEPVGYIDRGFEVGLGAGADLYLTIGYYSDSLYHLKLNKQVKINIFVISTPIGGVNFSKTYSDKYEESIYGIAISLAVKSCSNWELGFDDVEIFLTKKASSFMPYEARFYRYSPIYNWSEASDDLKKQKNKTYV